MSRGARPTGLVGILPVDKPAGMTSHDVVSVVRRATGERRVGHAGTLDPMATGLLVVLVGPATRLAPWLTTAEKTYEATIVFGSRTDTDDAEGDVIATAAVPAVLADPRVAEEHVRALEREHMQVPPAFSAIKVGGVVAHRAARAGTSLELEPRPIRVFRARLLGVTEGPPLAWDVELTVSKGTYIRALARDLGANLGTEAHLGALRRTASGTLSLEQAHLLVDVEAAGADVAAFFVDPVEALGLPEVHVSEQAALLVSHGARLTAEDVLAAGTPTEDSLAEGPLAPLPPLPPAGSFAAVTFGGTLLAVYQSRGDALSAAVILPKESS